MNIHKIIVIAIPFVLVIATAIAMGNDKRSLEMDICIANGEVYTACFCAIKDSNCDLEDYYKQKKD